MCKILDFSLFVQNTLFILLFFFGKIVFECMFIWFEWTDVLLLFGLVGGNV